ncbi:MAG TPA: YceI family protein [Thermohalobaculum sp.]|nr:YceI family protein [Thermohalobaculum sp.]
MRRPARIAALLLALAAGLAAAATQWAVVPDESRIVFGYEADGAPVEGVFTRFSGEGTFDPAAPGDATLELRIDSASIELGDARASAFATSAEWFDSANHPHVVYRLLGLTPLENTPLAGTSYRAEGELSIRGRARPVSTTVELAIGAEVARASGTLVIDRKDYGLGVGPMALFVDIGRDVAVRFELVARAAR